MNKATLLSITFLYGLIIYMIDRNFENISVTPVLSIFWLMLISFYQTKTHVFVGLLILLVFVILSLQDFSLAFIYIRTISYCLSGFLACLFAYSRLRSSQLLATTIRIIQDLPLPIVAADSQGTIIAASNSIVQLTTDKFNTLIGHHFPDVFMGQYSAGDAVRLFHESMLGKCPFNNQFKIRGLAYPPMDGKVSISGQGSNQLLIVTFTPVNGLTPDHAVS